MKRLAISIFTFIVFLAVNVNADAQGIKYGASDDESAEGTWGTNKKENYDVAIHITDASLIGKTVTGIIVPTVPNTTNWKAWLTKDLKLVDKQNAPDIDSVKFSPSDKKVTIMFSSPYTITQDGVYVGYSFDVSTLTDETKTPVLVVGSNDAEKFYLHTSRTYTKWASRPSLGIASALAVIIEGVPANAAAIGSLESAATQIKQLTNYTFHVLNHGSAGVNSVDYSYSVAGKTGTGHANLSIDAFYNKSGDVSFNLPEFDDPGNYTLKLAIDKVNGETNADAAISSQSGEITVYKVLPVHRPLLEEYTGTWCGYCPRGFVGLQRMNLLDPQNFIGISFHNGDAMEITTSFDNNVKGFPDAWIDRYHETDAYIGDNTTNSFGIDKVYSALAKTIAPADISLSAKWTDENKTAVTATSSVSFALDQSSNHWRVAYFLIADSLHGTTSRWQQHSYYTDGSMFADDSLMAPFIKNEYSYPYFSDVVIATSKSWVSGEEGSITAPITGGIPQTFDYTFNLADAVNTNGESLVQDKKHIRVVAALIDTETGHVVNAAKIGISQPETSGINNLDATNPLKVSLTYYSIDGKRLTAPQQGLNIVKTSDGKTFKVIKK